VVLISNIIIVNHKTKAPQQIIRMKIYKDSMLFGIHRDSPSYLDHYLLNLEFHFHLLILK